MYVRYLLLLTSEVQSLAQQAQKPSIEIQDITQALINVGMLKPVDILDVYEQYDTSNRAAQDFLLWCVGHVPENARNVSKVNLEMMASGKPKMAHSAIPEYNAQMLQSSQSQVSLNPLKSQEFEPQVEEDWLTFLMKRGKKQESFRSTTLIRNHLPKSDYYVSGPTPDELVDKLPYNQKPEELEEYQTEDLNTTGDQLINSGFIPPSDSYWSSQPLN